MSADDRRRADAEAILAAVPAGGIGVTKLRLLCRGMNRSQFVAAIAALLSDSRVSLNRLRVRKITKANA